MGPGGLNMPRVRDLLYRFRPAGAPGAASSVGVPADRGADVAAELEPVFTGLDQTERECAEIVASARREAGVARERDAERARSLVRSAKEHLEAERAASAARVRQQQGPDDLQAVAERAAVDLRDRARERMPVYVGSVLDAIRCLVAEEQPGSRTTVDGQ